MWPCVEACICPSVPSLGLFKRKCMIQQPVNYVFTPWPCHALLRVDVILLCVCCWCHHLFMYVACTSCVSTCIRKQQTKVWHPPKALSTLLWFHGNQRAANPHFGWREFLEMKHPALKLTAPQVGYRIPLPSLAKRTLLFLFSFLICFT